MAQSSLEIDQRAQAVLKFILPANWILSEEKPDVRHIDFRLHIVEAGASRPGGPQADLQVKGTTKPRRTKSGLAKPFETDHLAYWIDDCRLPVFLILVDVENEHGPQCPTRGSGHTPQLVVEF